MENCNFHVIASYKFNLATNSECGIFFTSFTITGAPTPGNIYAYKCFKHHMKQYNIIMVWRLSSEMPLSFVIMASAGRCCFPSANRWFEMALLSLAEILYL